MLAPVGQVEDIGPDGSAHHELRLKQSMGNDDDVASCTDRDVEWPWTKTGAEGDETLITIGDAERQALKDLATDRCLLAVGRQDFETGITVGGQVKRPIRVAQHAMYGCQREGGSQSSGSASVGQKAKTGFRSRSPAEQVWRVDPPPNVLSDVGFADVGVEVTRVYDAQDLAASDCCGDSLASERSFAELAASGGRLVSAFVRATKPTST